MTPDVPALSESNTWCLVMAVWTSLYGKEPYALDRSNHRTARSPLFSLTSWMSCVTLLHQRVNVVVTGEESSVPPHDYAEEDLSFHIQQGDHSELVDLL